MGNYIKTCIDSLLLKVSAHLYTECAHELVKVLTIKADTNEPNKAICRLCNKQLKRGWVDYE